MGVSRNANASLNVCIVVCTNCTTVKASQSAESLKTIHIQLDIVTQGEIHYNQQYRQYQIVIRFIITYTNITEHIMS